MSPDNVTVFGRRGYSGCAARDQLPQIFGVKAEVVASELGDGFAKLLAT
jgi:hypothetical protein